MKVIHIKLKKEFEKQEITGNFTSVNFKKYSLEFTLNILEGKNLEKGCENMETELQEFYCNQIDPEYAYNKLVGLDDIFR